jgi:phage FluMu protein Com
MAMIHGGKCPSCGQVNATLICEKVSTDHLFSDLKMSAVTYQCPSCRTILGVAPHPDSAATLVAQRVKARASR